MSTNLAFDEIVYFGDSLTDSGGFYQASDAVSFVPLPLTEAGYDKQFSNGPVYADYVPMLIGVTGDNDLNFAVGGARITADRTISDVLDDFPLKPWASEADLDFGVDFRDEVPRYLDSLPANADLSNVAISVFIGANDLRMFSPSDGPRGAQLDAAYAFGASVARAMYVQIEAAVDAGVGTVILNELPDGDVFPSSRFVSDFDVTIGTEAVHGFNDQLETIAGRIESAGSDAEILPLGVIYEEVSADPASFNFLDEYLAVYLGEGSEPIPNPEAVGVPEEQLMFFDQVHPTTEMHEIIAAFQAAALTSEVTIGDNRSDEFILGPEDDLVVGRGGDDTIIMRGGDDIALGGRGDDAIAGGPGSNILIGGAGDDTLRGGNGFDIIADGTGDDRIAGRGRADLIIVGDGSDIVRGGNGRDIVVWNDPAIIGGSVEGDQDVLNGGRGHDTLILRVDYLDDVMLDDDPTGLHVFDELGVTARNFEEIYVVEDLEPLPIRSGQIDTADLWHLV